MKVVINRCFGGFGLSKKAELWLYEHGVTEIATPAEAYHGGPGSSYYEKHRDDRHWKESLAESLRRWREYKDGGSSFCTVTFTPDEKYCIYAGDIKRDHPKLVQCVETLGKEANGECAKLAIVEIPDGVEWEISEYDGNEHIAESHRTWR